MEASDDDLFSPDAGDPSNVPSPEDKDYLSEFVGEGKKFKDPNALAHSVVHKDIHILKLEKENAEFRQELNKRENLEELYARLKADRSSPNIPAEQPEGEREELNIEQKVKSLLDQGLAQYTTETEQKQNLAFVVNKIRETIGPGYQKVLTDRARELGETEADMVKLARTKPKMFLQLMVPSSIASSSMPGLPHSSVNTSSGVSTGNVRNEAFYKKMKAENPKEYKSPKTQLQMHNDALALREKFFS